MEVTRADRLSAFLEQFEGKPVEWGSDDCSAAPALWFSEETGIDFGLPPYTSKEEAHALIEQAGGLLALWDHHGAMAGIQERFGDPEVGDVAIIDTRLHGQIGGICAAGRVLIIRNDNGGWSWFGPVRRFEKVWALPEG